jgi:hypothetical protein
MKSDPHNMTNYGVGSLRNFIEMYLSTGASVAKQHRLDCLDNRNEFSHTSGAWILKIKLSPELSF